ncbi:hypothetical protein D6C85_08125 [Aureobasidium pullulans]|uniref:Metallo-beta-lactamase domain-containing protein n=1 Tax=Aureobasidium pullulans TaxID=5580 RepID=A0A4S9WLP9_AURPU|nr:hypothetical protein D6C85_08125 [Aureobasidium pullulans]TIA22100.1 hypothetical protein D6C81_03491 [Aureobasidium pullulans]
MSKALQLPSGATTVRVRAIDTTTNMMCNASAFIEPVLKGHEQLNFKTMCFLVENEALNKRILKDFWNTSLHTREMIGGYVSCLKVEKGVDEILVDSNFDLDTLDAIIWSHWHWDHIGDASKFHAHTDIVVGPGFKAEFLPGYPEDPEGWILSSDTEQVNSSM